MARRRDDKLLAGMFKQMAESIDKTAQQVDKTTENLNKECRERKELNNWQKAMVDDMEDAVTGAIKDKLNDAVTYDVLRKMPTVKKKGDIYVEWQHIFPLPRSKFSTPACGATYFLCRVLGYIL